MVFQLYRIVILVIVVVVREAGSTRAAPYVIQIENIPL